MTITVDIKPEVQAELARQAAAQGRALEAYAASLLEGAAHLPGPRSVAPERRTGQCYRKLDAVWFDSSDPLHPRFNMFSDWPRCLPNLRGPGSWKLEYEVISENVPGSRITLSMDVRDNGGVCLRPVEVPPISDRSEAAPRRDGLG